MDAKTEEFIRLVKASGWSQAEVARQLHITPGAVSQLCSGKTRPRAGTVNLFKFIIAMKNPAALKVYERARSAALAPWENELLEALRRLPEKDRQRLLAPFKEMIGAFQAAGRRRRS